MTPVVRFKPGVTLTGLASGGVRLLAAIDNATRILGVDLTVTSTTDDHAPHDPHTLGNALDVRTRDLSEGQIYALVDYLRKQLGPAFTVLYEVRQKPSGVLAPYAYVNLAATAPHLHLQVKRGTVFPPVD